jgi:hypothetical protein
MPTEWRMPRIGVAWDSTDRPLEQVGYLLVDGGIWANNPVMLAVIEPLTCFDAGLARFKVLALGCGDDPYIVSAWQIRLGGLFLLGRI